MVAFFGPGLVRPDVIQAKSQSLVAQAQGQAGDPLSGLLVLENSFQNAVRRAWTANAQASLGLDNFLMQIADERTVAQYLLMRRLGVQAAESNPRKGAKRNPTQKEIDWEARKERERVAGVRPRNLKQTTLPNGIRVSTADVRCMVNDPDYVYETLVFPPDSIDNLDGRRDKTVAAALQTHVKFVVEYAHGIPHRLRRGVKKQKKMSAADWEAGRFTAPPTSLEQAVQDRLYKTRRDLASAPLDMTTALTVARAGGVSRQNPGLSPTPTGSKRDAKDSFGRTATYIEYQCPKHRSKFWRALGYSPHGCDECLIELRRLAESNPRGRSRARRNSSAPDLKALDREIRETLASSGTGQRRRAMVKRIRAESALFRFGTSVGWDREAVIQACLKGPSGWLGREVFEQSFDDGSMKAVAAVYARFENNARENPSETGRGSARDGYYTDSHGFWRGPPLPPAGLAFTVMIEDQSGRQGQYMGLPGASTTPFHRHGQRDSEVLWKDVLPWVRAMSRSHLRPGHEILVFDSSGRDVDIEAALKARSLDQVRELLTAAQKNPRRRNLRSKR